jgi:chromosomal replication initiator protein
MSGDERSFPELDDAQRRRWECVCSRLRAEFTEAVYRSWFGRLELRQAGDGVAQLTTPTRFLKTWIDAHYVDRLQAHFSAEFGDIGRISIEVREASARSSPTEPSVDDKSAPWAQGNTMVVGASSLLRDDRRS